MRVSLDGFVSSACSALKCSRDSHGASFAYILEGLRDDISAVVRGEKTIEQFAEFWCVKPARTEAATNALSARDQQDGGGG